MEKTRVLETRTEGIPVLWLKKLQEDWPELVYRRRKCKACGVRFNTAELPVDDLKTMLES
jgi:hypothetical protein